MYTKQELKQMALEATIRDGKKIDRVVTQRIDLDTRAESRSLSRRLHLERQETKFEESVMKYQEMKKLSQNQCGQEEKLAQELDVMKRKELKEKKDRQRIRENSLELRELEQKLKAAYTTKQLYAQLAEKEAERIHEKKKEMELLNELGNARVKDEIARKQMRQEEKERKDKLRKEIQDQIVAAHQMKLCSYEEYLQDKKLIDDITDKVHQEDMKEQEERMIKQQKTRQEMEEFKKAKEYWRQKERDRIEEENRKIAEYMNQKDEEAKNPCSKFQEKLALKEKVYNQIVQNSQKGEEEKRIRDDVINTLMAEEIKAKGEADRVAEIEREFRKRIDMRRGLDMQRRVREEAAKKEAAEDVAYRAALMQKMAEDARLEQMSNAKRRMKQLEHGRAIEAMMEEHRVRRAEEMQLAIKLYEYDQEEEQKRLRIIEEERIRMIREHATELAGFLPKGLIRPEDQKHLADLLPCPPNESSK